MRELGDHAVVLGASMGGLLAARVLADAYRKVSVVDRDPLPDGPHHRRGVPQDAHGHVLLPRGARAIEALFPGALTELEAAGVPVIRHDASRLHFATGGHLVRSDGPAQRSLEIYLASRPLLESLVRARLRALPDVDVVERTEVVGLETAGGSRVTGVQVAGEDGERVLGADLVVDAMGRGARTPAWLEQLGYPRPPEDRIPVEVSYRSALLHLPAERLHEQLVLVGPEPGRPRGCGLFGHEDGRRTFTAVGAAGHRPPRELGGMVEHAADLVPRHVLAALREAEPLGEVRSHRFPASRWRRYDRMPRFPAGLVVFADAVCSFNPIYGQGMTVAALEAEALAACLRRGPHDLPRRFFRAAAGPIGTAWQLAAGADLALPEVPGRRSWSFRLGTAVVERYLRAAERDPLVSERFFRVSSLVDPPRRLFRPGTALRVGRANLRR